MNEIQYGQLSSTFSYALAGLLALQAPLPTKMDHSANSRILSRSYITSSNEATFNSLGSNSLSSTITGAYESGFDSFRHSVSNFYSRLLACQEPLGAEFEKVLYDNLWDLYES